VGRGGTADNATYFCFVMGANALYLFSDLVDAAQNHTRRQGGNTMCEEESNDCCAGVRERTGTVLYKQHVCDVAGGDTGICMYMRRVGRVCLSLLAERRDLVCLFAHRCKDTCCCRTWMLSGEGVGEQPCCASAVGTMDGQTCGMIALTTKLVTGPVGLGGIQREGLESPEHGRVRAQYPWCTECARGCAPNPLLPSHYLAEPLLLGGLESSVVMEQTGGLRGWTHELQQVVSHATIGVASSTTPACHTCPVFAASSGWQRNWAKSPRSVVSGLFPDEE
jgi:hypothetical protein